MSRQKRAEVCLTFAEPAVSQLAGKAKKTVSTRMAKSAEAEGETEATGGQSESCVSGKLAAVAAAGVAAAAATATRASTDAEAPCFTTTEKNRSARCRELPTTSSSLALVPASSSSFSSSSLSGDVSSSSLASTSASSFGSTFAACSFFAEERKKGVLYIARLPPRMNRVTLRQYFERFGALGRLHVSPLLEEGRGSASASRQHRSRGRQPPSPSSKPSCEEGGEEQKKKKRMVAAAVSYRVKAFDLEFAGGAEAWLEFKSRKDAKKVARLLDGQPVSSWAAGMGHGRGSARKARRQWNGDIWCLKYLKGFTWQQLIEEKLYTRRVREARLNAALSQIKRENAVYMHLVEQQKQIDKMREKKQVKKLSQQEKQEQLARKDQAAESHFAAPGPMRAAGGGHSVRVMGLVGGNLWGTDANATNPTCKLQTPLAETRNSRSSNSDSSKRTGSCGSTTPAAEDSSSAQGGVRTPKRKLTTAEDEGAQLQRRAAKNGIDNYFKPGTPASRSKRIRDDPSYASLFALF